MVRTSIVKEIDSLKSFLEHGSSISGRAIQALDLRTLGVEWSSIDVRDAVFLGCQFADSETELALLRKGAYIFPRVGERPYDPYRSSLYTPLELLRGFEIGGPTGTQDYRIYQHYIDQSRNDPSIIEAMARRLHDQSIDDALAELVGEDETARVNKRIVGFMGMSLPISSRLPSPSTFLTAFERMACSRLPSMG